jgi:hypothetical protein
LKIRAQPPDQPALFFFGALMVQGDESFQNLFIL